MSFSDTIFLFFLALILFGPKKLPEMARQAGRLLAELRRASNEFRSQIETEISQLELEQKKQTILPPNPPPGAVANRSLSPSPSGAAGNDPIGALATPAPGATASEPAAAHPETPAAPDEAAPAPSLPASQESHV